MESTQTAKTRTVPTTIDCIGLSMPISTIPDCSDCMTTADNYTLFKMAASEIANSMGMICTFMPKPFSNRTGTGSHFHISMGSKKDKNLFADKKDPRGMGLSKLAYHFLAGILAHARGLCALAAPSVNSYKRLVVGRARARFDGVLRQ